MTLESIKNISVCIPTYNCDSTIEKVIEPFIQNKYELIVMDSGSTDKTLEILQSYGINHHYHPYETHAQQMNHTISFARTDWILCIDSDEIPSTEFMNAIEAINDLISKHHISIDTAYRIKRIWNVLGKDVNCMYPCSSPDYPVRLFNRKCCRYNDAPVDDKVIGFLKEERLQGSVHHITFQSIDVMKLKLNAYVERLLRYKNIKQSRLKGVCSALGAFYKWYFVRGGWKDKKVGIITALYAGFYSYKKYTCGTEKSR